MKKINKKTKAAKDESDEKPLEKAKDPEAPVFPELMGKYTVKRELGRGTFSPISTFRIIWHSVQSGESYDWRSVRHKADFANDARELHSNGSPVSAAAEVCPEIAKL